MKNEFFDNVLEIGRQSGELGRLRKRLEPILAPNFDSLNLEVENFSVSDTPQGVIKRIVTHGGLREADFQYLVTVNAMEKLKTTLRLIEAQAALVPQIEKKRKSALEKSLEDDRHQIAVRFEKAVSAVSKALGDEENIGIQGDRKFEKMKKSLLDMRESLVGDLDRIVFNLVDSDILAMSKEELLELIAEERLHCVELVLDANDKHLRKMARELYEASYLMKATDLAIIPDKKLPFAERKQALDLLHKEIDLRVDSVTLSLGKCQKRIDACKQYMEKIFDMGNGIPNPADFTPVRYVGAPVRTLFDFNP